MLGKPACRRPHSIHFPETNKDSRGFRRRRGHGRVVFRACAGCRRANGAGPLAALAEMGVQKPTTMELQRSAIMKTQEKTSQRRRFERATVLWSGHLAFGDQVIACLIVNISANGAMVRTDEAGVCASMVTLHNPRIGKLAAEVRWRKHDELGLKFLDDDEAVAAVIGKALK